MRNRPLPIPIVLNNSAAGLPAAVELELLRQAVRMAEEQLGPALDADKRNPYTAHLRQAEAAAKRAKANWQEAWDANKRMPGIIHPSELERLHLRAKIAQLRLAETRTADIRLTLNRLQSQLKELGEEVHQLRDRVAMLSTRNPLRT